VQSSNGLYCVFIISTAPFGNVVVSASFANTAS